MNVLILTHLYPRHESHSVKEISWAIHDLVKGLDNNNIKVAQVLRPISEIQWRKLSRNKIDCSNEINGIKVQTKSFFNIPKGGFFLTPKDIKYFSSILKDVDLIVSHMHTGARLAEKLSNIFNIPFIFVVHNSDLSRIKVNSKVIKNAQNVYGRSWAINKRLKEKCIETHGVVFSGIDEKIILPLREHKNDKVKIISVCFLQKLKNVDVTIEVLASLLEYNWSYTIIGDGEEKFYLNNLIKKFNLEDRITMLGFKQRNFCLEKMSNSDVFVMPSSPETFGLAYLEAMASGCLVVGAKDWGIDGLVKDAENGYLVEARNYRDLKELFIKLFTNEQNKLYANSHKSIYCYTLKKAHKNYSSIISENMTKL